LFGLLHRSIFSELVKVFLFSLLGITGIIVLAAIVQQASQRGLGPMQILAAIPLLVPSMLPFIIPPTTLFTACVIYGRLSNDNEVTAIKSAGISVLHVIWPGVVLGLSMSLVTVGLYYKLIPYTQQLIRALVVRDVEEFLYGMLKRDGEIARSDLKLGYEIFVKQVQGRHLRTAVFKRRAPHGGGYDVIAYADEAELKVDLANKEIEVHMRHGYARYEAKGTNGYFANQIFRVPLHDLKQTTVLTWRDMTWPELMDTRSGILATIDKLKGTMASLFTQEAMPNPPPSIGQNIRNHEAELRQEEQKLHGLDAELYMRPALSFGCLFFVLVGCPVGIWLSKSDYLSAFISCFLPIVILYYPIQLCMTNLAKDGKIHPALALWAANAAMGVMSLGLFHRLLKN
jgi:lipopolysaccharide export system permease protein